MSQTLNKLNEEITLTHTPTSRWLLNVKKSPDAFTLYHFYCYTASWQGNTSVRATTNFVLKGLGWGKDRFFKTKKILQESGIIKDITRRDKKGKIEGNYILVRYINNSSTVLENHTVDYATSGSQTTNTNKDNINTNLYNINTGNDQLVEKEVELNQGSGSKKESPSFLSSLSSQGMPERSEGRGPLGELSSKPDSKLTPSPPIPVSPPSPELEEYLEKKALNKAKKRIKNQYGGTIPPWVDLEKEAKTEERPRLTVTQTVPELEEFAQFLKWLKSIHRPSTYHPDTEANWKRVRQTFEVPEIKAAVKIALLDDWWKDNFTIHLFLRPTNADGNPVDHVATFYSRRAGGDYEITKIKQEMAKEMGKK